MFRPLPSIRQRLARLPLPAAAAAVLLGWAFLVASLVTEAAAGEAAAMRPGLGPDSAASRPVLRMGYTEFPPYSFSGAGGEGQGFSIDVLRAAADRAGYGLAVVPAQNPAAMLAMLAAGAIDATSLLAMTSSRLEQGAFTDPIAPLGVSLVVRRGETEITDPIGLRGLRVGVTRGSYGHRVAEGTEAAEIVGFGSIGELMMALLGEEVDAAVTPLMPFRRLAERAGLDGRIEVLGAPLHESQIGFMVESGDRPLLDRLNRALAEMRRDGTLEGLKTVWFDRPYSIWLDARIAWAAAAAVTLVLVVGGMLGLLCVLRSTRRSARAIRASWDTLMAALDGIDTVMVIFDAEMRAIHWNRETERRFPKLLPLLRRGGTLTELIANSYRDGEIASAMSAEEADAFARRVTASLMAGESSERIVRTAAGDVLRARDYYLPSGHFVSMRFDVTRMMQGQEDLAAANAELGRANDRLAQANEQLERFTGVAAHDLRAPLRALMTLPGWVREELTEAGVALPGEVSPLLDEMLDQAAAMDRMLQDLLTYARLGGDAAGRTRFRPAERIAEIARMAGLPDEFTLDVAPDLPWLVLSTVEFDTVMRNLLGNAVKHHDTSVGRITVAGRVEDGCAVLEVADDGPGIAPEHRQRVFEIFSVLGQREGPGGGMGLAFVRRIVESWGGSVTIHAPGSGRGSVFRLVIPMPEALAVAA